MMNQDKQDILYINGKITCVRPVGVEVEAMLTRGDRILAVGSRQELEALAGVACHRVDLKGKRVLPGLIDSHAHFLDTGFSVTRLNLGQVKSIQDLLGQLAFAAEGKSDGDWVIAVNFDESRLAEKRMPSLEELDEAVPEHPVYINHRGYHSSLLNSRALKETGLTFKAEKDPRGGAYLSRDNNTTLKSWIADQTQEGDLKKAMAAAGKLAVERGLTSVHCIEGGDFWGDAYAEFLNDNPSDLLDLVLFYNTENVARIRELGLPRMGGDIFLDGSISGRTAAMRSNYADAETAGALYRTDAELEVLIDQAHQAGIQISFHVIGDKAIDQALRVYERVLSRYPDRDHRHRIEHFGFPSDDQIEKAKKLGLAIATQPAFVYLKGENYGLRVGQKRLEHAYPLKKLLDAGLRVGGGSDSLVTPMDPFLGIHSAVNAPYEFQRLTVMEALEIYSIRAAELVFEEKDKGSLEPGKFADFIVLEEDLLHLEPSKIMDIQVEKTIYRGMCVYENHKEE